MRCRRRGAALVAKPVFNSVGCVPQQLCRSRPHFYKILKILLTPTTTSSNNNNNNNNNDNNNNNNNNSNNNGWVCELFGSSHKANSRNIVPQLGSLVETLGNRFEKVKAQTGCPFFSAYFSNTFLCIIFGCRFGAAYFSITFLYLNFWGRFRATT